MTDMIERLKRYAVATINVVAIGISGSILISDPTSNVVLLPVLAGVVLPSHALRAEQLRPLSYATIGFCLGIVLFAVGFGILRATEIVGPGQRLPGADVLGTVVLTGILVTAYVGLIRRGSREIGAHA